MLFRSASHFVHLAICNLAWNKDFITTVECPYSENEIRDILNYMKIRFLKYKYNDALDVIELYLMSGGMPSTYISTIHSWINNGNENDNFQWIAKPTFNFQPLYETNLNKTKTKHCFDMFTEV